MSLPKPIYNALPYIYLLAGVLTPLLLYSRIAAISAVLFFAAGGITLAERSLNRRGQTSHDRDLASS